jgi:hypothetical protein
MHALASTGGPDEGSDYEKMIAHLEYQLGESNYSIYGIQSVLKIGPRDDVN